MYLDCLLSNTTGKAELIFHRTAHCAASPLGSNSTALWQM